MTTRHKGLGRGLDALLGGNDRNAKDQDSMREIAVASLRPGRYQPRTRMDEASLAQLADSVRARGVIQPIVVRPVDGGHYEILAGARRWRAARLAGLERVPAVVREVPDEAALGIGLIENIQREDLNPIEEASGLKRLIEEFKLTHDEVAKAIGRSRAGVTNLLRLLELAAAVQAMVQDGRIDMGHARRSPRCRSRARSSSRRESCTTDFGARCRTPRAGGLGHAARGPPLGAAPGLRLAPPPGRAFGAPRRDGEAQAAARRKGLGGDRLFEPRRASGHRREAARLTL